MANADAAERPAAGPPPTGPDREAVVRDAVERYTVQRPALEALCAAVVRTVTGILDEAGVNYLTVRGRTKSVASFADKARRTVDGRPLFPDPLHDIQDQVGLRVITYVRADVDGVAALLGQQLTVVDDRDMGRQTASEGRFGYASRHLSLLVDHATAEGTVRPRPVQVQIRTVLQHAWAEFEHDIRYKGSIPEEHRSEFDRRFTLAAGLLELADREFSAINDRLRGPSTPVDDVGPDPRIDPKELAAFLAGQYADAGWSRPDHYAWISGLLLELGIDGLGALAQELRTVDEQAIAARMAYRYPPGAVRRLDDALLARFGPAYVALRGNGDRRAALAQRWAKLSADA